MRRHTKIERATIPISGDKPRVLYRANKTLLFHLSWCAGTRIRTTRSPHAGRRVYFRRRHIFLPNSVNLRFRFLFRVLISINLIIHTWQNRTNTGILTGLGTHTSGGVTSSSYTCMNARNLEMGTCTTLAFLTRDLVLSLSLLDLH